MFEGQQLKLVPAIQFEVEGLVVRSSCFLCSLGRRSASREKVRSVRLVKMKQC